MIIQDNSGRCHTRMYLKDCIFKTMVKKIINTNNCRPYYPPHKDGQYHPSHKNGSIPKHNWTGGIRTSLSNTSNHQLSYHGNVMYCILTHTLLCAPFTRTNITSQYNFMICISSTTFVIVQFIIILPYLLSSLTIFPPEKKSLFLFLKHIYICSYV